MLLSSDVKFVCLALQFTADSCDVKFMSNSYECSINNNLWYYLKENKLEKYKSRGANDTLCRPLGLGKYCSVHKPIYTWINILLVEWLNQ